jgi:predicted RNase H-like HicB family nuclease
MSLAMIEDWGAFPSIDERDAAEAHDYLVVLERSSTGWGAYVPDLPGVIAVAADKDDVRKLISEALALHLEGLRADGELIPEPNSQPMWSGG